MECVCARGEGGNGYSRNYGGERTDTRFSDIGNFPGNFPDRYLYLFVAILNRVAADRLRRMHRSTNSIETHNAVCMRTYLIVSKVTRYQPIHYPKPKPPQRNHTHSLTQDLRLLKISLSPPPPRARPSKRTFESTEPIIINNNNESTLG